MNTMLQSIVAFLTSRELAVDFIANLGGVMAGVLLAFWIERGRARRDAKALYGRILRTSRSELAYLKPMCEHREGSSKAGGSVGFPETNGVPATRGLLANPLVHDHAPYSLIMTLTILCAHLGITERAFRETSRFNPIHVAAHETLPKLLRVQLDQTISLITIALEQIDAQLKLMGHETIQDEATQVVSQKLREILQSPIA